jgi:hypothetical protein
MVVSSGRIGHYLFHVSANRDVGDQLIPAKFSIHLSYRIKSVQFSLRLNINFPSCNAS